MKVCCRAAEGVQHELKPFVKLRERWGRAPRDQLSGAGLKPVRAAAVKSRGGERRIKSSDQTEQVRSPVHRRGAHNNNPRLLGLTLAHPGRSVNPVVYGTK